MAILETKNLSYTYAKGSPFSHAALKNVSVSFAQGELTAIIGHTGSGKSTLIQHLNGLLKPSEGQVLLNGKDIWENPKEIRNIRFQVGMVFQYPEHQLFEDTVFKDISFGPKNMGLSEEEIANRVTQAADFAGLSPDLLQKSPFDLSGGEKRRVAIAGVLAMRPKVLILDEPTAGLDPAGRDALLEQINRYRKQNDATVLLVSHRMEDVAHIADKVLVMQDGEAVMYDTPAAVFSQDTRLEKMGLTVPSVTRIISLLKEKGVEIKEDVYTVEDAVSVLCTLLKDKGVGEC